MRSTVSRSSASRSTHSEKRRCSGGFLASRRRALARYVCSPTILRRVEGDDGIGPSRLHDRAVDAVWVGIVILRLGPRLLAFGPQPAASRIGIARYFERVEDQPSLRSRRGPPGTLGAGAAQDAVAGRACRASPGADRASRSEVAGGDREDTFVVREDDLDDLTALLQGSRRLASVWDSRRARPSWFCV